MGVCAKIVNWNSTSVAKMEIEMESVAKSYVLVFIILRFISSTFKSRPCSIRMLWVPFMFSIFKDAHDLLLKFSLSVLMQFLSPLNLVQLQMKNMHFTNFQACVYVLNVICSFIRWPPLLHNLTHFEWVILCTKCYKSASLKQLIRRVFVLDSAFFVVFVMFSFLFLFTSWHA